MPTNDQPDFPRPDPGDPLPSEREVLRSLVQVLTMHEKRFFALTTRLAAVNAFLRIDLPILLRNVVSAGKPGEMTEQRANELAGFIHRVRSKIESDLDSNVVTAMAHDESASLRETIDVLERFLLESEGQL